MKTVCYRLLLIFSFLIMIGCPEDPPFPNEIIGKWVTDNATYSDRYIEISETQLIFSTGEVEPNIFFIEKIQGEKQPEGVEWILDCEDIQGESFEFSLFYSDHANGEQIKLKNQPNVNWTKFRE